MIFDKFFRKEVTAEALAGDMFQMIVLDDIDDFCKEHLPSWRTQKSFNEPVYRYTLFTYLTAMVATVLTTQSNKDSSFNKVIPYFRRHAEDVAQKYWNITANELEKVIVEHSANLVRLIFTDPKPNHALTLEWTIAWLQLFGVEEHNPVTLFMIAHKWEIAFVELAKMFNTLKVA